MSSQTETTSTDNVEERESLVVVAVDRVAALSLFLLAGSSYQQMIGSIFESSDTAWLIKTGELILRQGSLPVGDPFSWTKHDAGLVLYQWLYELICAALYEAGGLRLVGVVSCLLTGLVVWLLLPYQMFQNRVRASYVFGFVWLISCHTWFLLRPQLVSFVLIPVFMMILEKFRQKGVTKWLFALPPLMVLWANMHSFWFIGCLLVAVYLVPAIRRVKQRTLLISILLSTILAVLINPYGTGLVAYVAGFLQGPAFAALYELRPLLLTEWKLNLHNLLYVILSIGVIFVGRKTVPIYGMVLAVVSAIAGIVFNRFFPVAVLLSWPYLALALGGLEATRRTSNKFIDKTLLTYGLSIYAVLSIPIFFNVQFPKNRPIWFTHTYSNLGAITYLNHNFELRKKMFCDASFGCSQIFSNLTPVFIDTRFDLYGKAFFEEWLDCLNAKGDWQGYLDRWGIETVAVSVQYDLNAAIKKSPLWQVVFDDGNYTILIRRRTSAPHKNAGD